MPQEHWLAAQVEASISQVEMHLQERELEARRDRSISMAEMLSTTRTRNSVTLEQRAAALILAGGQAVAVAALQCAAHKLLMVIKTQTLAQSI